MPDVVRVDLVDEGAFWRVRFGGSRGNILDGATLQALSGVFTQARSSRALKAICLEGAGDDFSFGASVQEHLPAAVPAMLTALRTCVLDLLDSDVIVLAAVQGRCLGGGLELASVCHRLVAAPGATFGQPEIGLGVFAPLGSIVLPARVGRARGEDLCLTGRSITAAEAQSIGLVDEIADDPTAAALAWARAHFSNRSASSLRLAVRAVRADLTARIRSELPALEKLYVEELMATGDAVEGLQAFLEKRPPKWRNA
jgi:cyclohexa-1,5-dienecarbonyl-CoA hydratase